MSKPKILVARAVFPEVIARLEQHFEVESNQSDETWSKAQLTERLKGKDGAYTTGGGAPWRGAYISAPIDSDPWGNRYAVNVLYLRTAPTSNDVFVLSAGPDEEIDTAFTVNGVVPGDDDIIAVIRRDPGRTVP